MLPPQLQTPASYALYLKYSGYDKHVVPRERELKPSSVQRVPQLPDSSSPRRPTEDPPSPRTLVVQKHKHVLVKKRTFRSTTAKKSPFKKAN